MSQPQPAAGHTDELYSLLMPLHEARLILPRVCVAEVVRHTGLEPAAGAPDWVRGHLPWNGRRVPVLSFEALAGLAAVPPGGRTRVAIIHAASPALAAGCFGILTEGFPQLVRVNRDVIHLHDPHPWPADGPVICQIRMINEYPLIPDLDRLEGLLQEAGL
jgi:chemosensory pili system protein ChpC